MISSLDRRVAVELIKEAKESGARLVKACDELEISKRTYNRWRKDGGDEDKRKTCERKPPKSKLSEEEKNTIVEKLNTKEYESLPPSQAVPKLADEGIYLASESTMYRILRERGELKNRGLSKPRTTRTITTHVATNPNEVWTWDITYLNAGIKGIYFYLYMIIDIYSRKIVCWEVHGRENADNASELIKRACLCEKIRTEETMLVLHSDNGSPMKGATMLETLRKLGIDASNSRPRVSNDNPYSESLFKTLKYKPDFKTKGFASIEEARIWTKNFVDWYNNEHRHSGINFVSPGKRHNGKDKEILKKRKEVYETAKQVHPERWAREIRDWSPVGNVYLNPEKEIKVIEKPVDAKAS